MVERRFVGIGDIMVADVAVHLPFGPVCARETLSMSSPIVFAHSMIQLRLRVTRAATRMGRARAADVYCFELATQNQTRTTHQRVHRVTGCHREN